MDKDFNLIITRLNRLLVLIIKVIIILININFILNVIIIRVIISSTSTTGLCNSRG